MFGAFQDLSFLLHVTQYEGRSIEKLIAPREAGLASSTLGGAVIEASYVRTDPPLLAHLAEARVPWMVDAQSIRFASPGFREVARLRGLPYAPDAPLDPGRFTATVERMIRGALEFQAQAEPSMQGIQPLDLEHLETWRAVLTRVATVVAVRDR